MRIDQVYNWIEVHKPEVILEVGTWDGENAKRMLREGAKKYIGFDLWEEGNEIYDDLENNVKRRVELSEVQEKLKEFDIELIKGNTRQTLVEYSKSHKPFVDMALIDGGHSKGTIKSDLLAIIPIMNTNGAIFIDDYYFDCPITNVGAQEVLRDSNIPFTVLPKPGTAKDKVTGKKYLIKIVRIDMKDVPRPNVWEAPSSAWRFEPAA